MFDPHHFVPCGTAAERRLLLVFVFSLQLNCLVALLSYMEYQARLFALLPRAKCSVYQLVDS